VVVVLGSIVVEVELVVVGMDVVEVVGMLDEVVVGTIDVVVVVGIIEVVVVVSIDVVVLVVTSMLDSSAYT
jgi:hypothetical protein